MTARMRETLEQAAKQPLRRVHDDKPGQPPWPANPATLHALVRRGLLERSELRNRKGWPITVWAPTVAGLEALKPVVVYKRDVPLYLARCGAIRYRTLPNGRWVVDNSADGNGDYTTDPRKSIDHDLAPSSKTSNAVEVLVTSGDLDQFAAEARKREQQRRRENARDLDSSPLEQRLRQVQSLARDHHVDFTSECRHINYLITHGHTETAAKCLARAETTLRLRAA